jgi:hypothetical protein
MLDYANTKGFLCQIEQSSLTWNEEGVSAQAPSPVGTSVPLRVNEDTLENDHYFRRRGNSMDTLIGFLQPALAFVVFALCAAMMGIR